MPYVETRHESERGCGYRKPGGLYLVSGRGSRGCDKLPIPLEVCPCCGQGIKPTRGFSWITADLVRSHPCSKKGCKGCGPPWSNYEFDKFGLIWVGEQFYKKPQDFNREAEALGISRRISQIPRDLVVGKTWVMLAHRKAIDSYGDGGVPEFKPGIFRAYCPTHIEYVVKEDDPPEKLEKLEQRGITLIRVIQS